METSRRFCGFSASNCCPQPKLREPRYAIRQSISGFGICCRRATIRCWCSAAAQPGDSHSLVALHAPWNRRCRHRVWRVDGPASGRGQCDHCNLHRCLGVCLCLLGGICRHNAWIAAPAAAASPAPGTLVPAIAGCRLRWHHRVSLRWLDRRNRWRSGSLAERPEIRSATICRLVSIAVINSENADPLAASSTRQVLEHVRTRPGATG